MSRVRTHGAELAVGARSRSEDIGPRRVQLKVWRRTGRDLQRFGGERSGASGGGGEECCIFKHRGQGQAPWAFRAWGSGGDGIYPGTQRAVRERGRRICPPGNDQSKIHG